MWNLIINVTDSVSTNVTNILPTSVTNIVSTNFDNKRNDIKCSSCY